MSGISSMVKVRSLGCSMLREAIMAGTLQPNPMIKGIIAFPFKPASCINLSIITVMRAI
ncbi:hypothetical protein D3C77_689620 [compost metagenome]